MNGAGFNFCGLIIALEEKSWPDILILKVDLGWGVICGALLFCGGAAVPCFPAPELLGAPPHLVNCPTR